MDGKNFLDCFQFHDQPIVDDQIHAVATIQFDRLVNDRKSHLAPKSNTAGLQFVAETLLVSRLQEPWTQSYGVLRWQDRSPNRSKDLVRFGQGPQAFNQPFVFPQTYFIFFSVSLCLCASVVP